MELNLRERFYKSLIKRDDTFLAMLRVSEEAGVESTRKMMGLDGEQAETFVEILFETLDKVFEERGLTHRDVTLLAAKRMTDEFFSGPLSVAPLHILKDPEMISGVVGMIMGECKVAKEDRPEVEKIYREKVESLDE